MSTKFTQKEFNLIMFDTSFMDILALFYWHLEFSFARIFIIISKIVRNRKQNQVPADLHEALKNFRILDEDLLDEIINSL